MQVEAIQRSFAKIPGLRGGTRAAPPPRAVFPTTHLPDLDAGGGLVDSLDLALESSVSANVMRRRGVSNDLRDRGDEWPLLPVVSGLSVVVATVVDEVSIVFGTAAAPLRLALFLWCCIVAAASSLRLRTRGGLRGAANVSNRCGIARLRSATTSQARLAKFAEIASVL